MKIRERCSCGAEFEVGARMTTIDATLGGGGGVDTNVLLPLPHYTQCQLCDTWIDGWNGPIVALLNHHQQAHPCTCKTRSIVRKVGQRGHFEKHTLTLVCDTHRRCPECGSVLVNRRCPRCDQ